MNQAAPKKLDTNDALKTYRYLRIGMVAAVLALAVSVLIERSKVDCWQNSLSAYYYTPARAIFVGALIVTGFALIVIRGRTTSEDLCLNLAGMLAPVVAVAPTTNVGDCYSIAPMPLPEQDGELARWVVTNIDNNFYTLLITGAAGWIVAVVIAVLIRQGLVGRDEKLAKGTAVALLVVALVLLASWWLIESWSDFYIKAHGYAAVAMFLFLIGAIFSKAVELWKESDRKYFLTYMVVGLVMFWGGIAIFVAPIGDHKVLILEAYEILWFALYWIVQTIEHWNEKTTQPAEGTLAAT